MWRSLGRIGESVDMIFNLPYKWFTSGKIVRNATKRTAVAKEDTMVINEMEYAFSPGETILQVAERNGIDIPTICHLEGFTPTGVNEIIQDFLYRRRRHERIGRSSFAVQKKPAYDYTSTSGSAERVRLFA